MLDTNFSPINLLPFCTGAKNTFVSYDNMYSSMIDFICMSNDRIDIVTRAEIFDDSSLNVSRHRPVMVCIDIPNCDNMFNETMCINRVNWKRATEVQLCNYVESVTESEIIQNSPSVYESAKDVEASYETLCDILTGSASNSIGHRSFQSHLKQFWNSELGSSHGEMGRRRADWCRAGRPRCHTDVVYSAYKNAKRVFRKIYRKAANDHMLQLNREIDKSAEMNSNDF